MADALTDRLVAVLRRIDAVTYNRGHSPRPVRGEDVAVIERANAAEPLRPPRSIFCWDCTEADEQPVDPYDTQGPTWADHIHERHAAWLEARALLDEIDGASTC